jgi:transcription antitermination factor NusG
MLEVGRWYVLQVRYRSEKIVARLLHEKAYKQLVPTYSSTRRLKARTRQVERPLFDNHVFCQVTVSARGPIVTTPGVVRIVGAGSEPIPVDDDEIEGLQRIMKAGLSVEPWPCLHVGR